MTNKIICMIGLFPPPLHGMSLITDCVRKNIALDRPPLVINTSPGRLDRSIYLHVMKFVRVISGLFLFLYNLMFFRVGTVYLAVSGGLGQVYDIAFVLLSRLFARRLYLHHHNYKYLEQYNVLTWLLCLLAGRQANHVVACEKMAVALRCKYPVVNNVRIISGISALDGWASPVRNRIKVHTIGYLSNISTEKGILEFLDVAERAQQLNLPVKFLIAGPFHNTNIKEVVEQRLRILAQTVYVGAVYGNEKCVFLDSIDVLLFPTRNEAEGLVIHEAMSRCVPVIAQARGCIEHIISDHTGSCISIYDSYVNRAVKKIVELLNDEQHFQKISSNAREQYVARKMYYKIEMERLINDMHCEFEGREV